MKALHLCTVASIAVVLGLFLAIHSPRSACAGTAAGDRVLTGELVVIKGARNQFRLVDHNGSFTAPAGTAVEELDGKPVEVELGQNGRVLQIRQMPIHIEPITHGFEVISGQVVQSDPVTHTFAIAGDARAYVAPQGIDIGQYVGRLVEMRLDEQGRVVNINLIARSADAPVPLSVPACMLGDASIVGGSSICRDGRTLRCVNGEWVNLGTPCSEPAAR